jgi:hypothetical protein
VRLQASIASLHFGVRLPYGFDLDEAKKYLNEMEAKMKGNDQSLGRKRRKLLFDSHGDRYLVGYRLNQHSILRHVECPVLLLI